MQINYALILSAGIGSRMGEVGKKLPKPLWPIFFKNLLELQIDFCNEMGIKNIFINTHFLAEEIESFIRSNKKFDGITLLHEDPLLDSGGAIHNMASRGDVNYSGNLLMINSDQFLFFDKKYFEEAIVALDNSRAALFGIKVGKNSKYNETVIIDDQLKEIKKADGVSDYVTYSGLGLLKLEGLEPVAGATKFFETVANFNQERVQFVVPEKFEYWDFGTAEIYFNSIKKIYSLLKAKKRCLLMDFLEENGAFNGNEDNFYNSDLDSINLDGAHLFEASCILGKGLVQKI